MNITLAISKIYDITTDECYGYITVPNYDYLLDSKCLYEFVCTSSMSGSDITLEIFSKLFLILFFSAKE